MELSDIAATLKNGRLFSKKSKILFMITMIVWVVAIFYILIITFFNIIPKESIYPITPLQFAVLFVCVFGFSVGVFIYLLCKNRKIEKAVHRYLTDSDIIMLSAKSIDITDSSHDRIYNGSRIQLTFYYGGEIYVKTSILDKVFRGYKNREINILYSPKYDEVLLLRNNN